MAISKSKKLSEYNGHLLKAENGDEFMLLVMEDGSALLSVGNPKHNGGGIYMTIHEEVRSEIGKLLLKGYMA